MPLKIYSTDNIDREKWAKLTNNSFYSSPEFVSLWTAMDGRGIFIVDEDEELYQAGIAGIIYGRRFLRRFQSMPDGFKGGFHFLTELNDIVKSEFVQQVIDWFRSASIIRADIHAPDFKPDSKFFVNRTTETHIIDLKNWEDESINKNAQKVIRIGKKRGAEINRFENRKDIERFYELVVKSEKKHGGEPRYSKSFFEKLFDFAIDDKRILWLEGRKDDQLIASQINFIENNDLFLWQYYADHQFQSLKPGYLLNDYCINWAIENKMKSVNLGWTPPLAEGLSDYKKKWGAHKEPFHYYTFYGGFLGKLIYQWRDK